MVITNNGPYRVRLSKMIGALNNITDYRQVQTIPQYQSLTNILLGPSESVCFGSSTIAPARCANKTIFFTTTNYTGAEYPGNYELSTNVVCNNDGTGYVVLRDFGFEYIIYVENIPLTKRLTGKPLAARCAPR
jgi:hypothetical protein